MYRRLLIVAFTLIGIGICIHFLSSTNFFFESPYEVVVTPTPSHDVVPVSFSNPFSTKNEIAILKETYQNDDIIAKIEIENTDFSSVVLQAEDNEFYLDHDLSGKPDGMGSTFLDYRNVLTNQKLLIYGHNSRNVNTEFQILEQYLDESFYPEHSILTLRSENGYYRYQAFAILIVKDEVEHMKLSFTEEEYQTHLNYLKENSLYDTGASVSTDDDILLLQTCYYYPENSFIVVAFRKI